MKQLTLTLLFSLSLAIAFGQSRIKPDTEKGKKYWRLDTCIVDSKVPICVYQQRKDSYTYRNDTCFLHKAAGYTAIYIKRKSMDSVRFILYHGRLHPVDTTGVSLHLHSLIQMRLYNQGDGAQ